MGRRMSRTVKRRGRCRVDGAHSVTLRAGEQSEKKSLPRARADTFQNACLSFTLRAVRAYVRVWGALSRAKWLTRITAAGFVVIWEKEKAYTAIERSAPYVPFLFLCYNARSGRRALPYFGKWSRAGVTISKKALLHINFAVVV